MEVLIARCCGLDVHQASITACALIDEGGAKPRKYIRTFRAVQDGRDGLKAAREWLLSLGVTHVTMEGTGVYWRPVYELFEGHIDLTLVNARHVKQVPGRKTDVNDAEWLANLLRHGLLRKSFVPEKEIRALRDLTRYRRMLIQSATAEKNRILKLLETMGVKLSAVASDVFGASGTAMIRALAQGDVSIDAIVNMAKGRLRAKMADLKLALSVLVEEHHRMMLRDQLERLDRTTQEIARYDELLSIRVAPYQDTIDLLCTIDGVQRCAAIEIFAEVGPNLASFPSDGHFSSWAGTCPGQHESAGKRGNARRRRGNPYLQSILTECALAATRKKNTYLKDKYYRLKAKRGSMRALFAIAHKLCRSVYRVITTGQPYRDLGATYLDARDPLPLAKRLVARLENLGFDAAAVATLFSQ